MGWAIAIIGGIILLILIFGVVSYNRFVSQRQLIKDAWANIDTELRRRYDLIPTSSSPSAATRRTSAPCSRT
jgi:LemA protein